MVLLNSFSFRKYFNRCLNWGTGCDSIRKVRRGETFLRPTVHLSRALVWDLLTGVTMMRQVAIRINQRLESTRIEVLPFNAEGVAPKSTGLTKGFAEYKYKVIVTLLQETFVGNKRSRTLIL